MELRTKTRSIGNDFWISSFGQLILFYPLYKQTRKETNQTHTSNLFIAPFNTTSKSPYYSCRLHCSVNIYDLFWQSLSSIPIPRVAKLSHHRSHISNNNVRMSWDSSSLLHGTGSPTVFAHSATSGPCKGHSLNHKRLDNPGTLPTG